MLQLGLGVGSRRAAVLTEEKLGQQPELAPHRAPSSPAWLREVPQIPIQHFATSKGFVAWVWFFFSAVTSEEGEMPH